MLYNVHFDCVHNIHTFCSHLQPIEKVSSKIVLHVTEVCVFPQIATGIIEVRAGEGEREEKNQKR